MSTAVQLKLLTLLNVSAIKRPRDADQPGAQRRSISVSPSVQIQPQRSNEGESSNGAGETSEEPPKKKKRGVSFGGEVGPSGSGGKKEKTSKRKEDAAAGKEQVNDASKAAKSIPVIEEEVSETDVTESQLQAEEDSDDEATANGTSSSVAGECTLTTQSSFLHSIRLNLLFSGSIQRPFRTGASNPETRSACRCGVK